MADSILKLKVQSEEYDQKLKKAVEGIRHLAEVAHRGAGELTGLEQAELDYVRSLGEMETKSRTAAGSVRELESAYKELKVIYDNLNDVEKNDESGKAIAASLDRIKERAQEARAQLDSASRSLQDNGQTAQQTGGIIGELSSKLGISITKLAGWGTAIAAAKAEEEAPLPEEEDVVIELPVEEDASIDEPAAAPEETPAVDEMPAVMPEETPEVETPEVTPEVETPAAPASNSALDVLNAIWGAYADDDKFAIYGGNMEEAVMDAPGVFNMAYAEGLTYNLLVPAEQIANVAEAASMIHMMNANTFTCGVFRLADGVAAADFAAAMEAAVMSNQWMCGFPETLVIAEIDGHVLVAFGINDAMNPFQTHLAEAFAGASVLYNEPIA